MTLNKNIPQKIIIIMKSDTIHKMPTKNSYTHHDANIFFLIYETKL